MFCAPKSETSNRKIDLSPVLRKILLEHKLRSGANRSELVFSNAEGNPVDVSNFLKRKFYPAVEAAKLGRLRFHDLRHTFGSLKIKQGENLKYVQTQMRHSSIEVTVDVYAHLLDQSNPEAAARTDELVFGAARKSS